MKEAKFSAALVTFGSFRDRYSDYKEPKSTPELLEEATKVDGLSGIEFVSGWDLKDEYLDDIRASLEKTGLMPVACIANLSFSPRWAKGSFAANDPETQKAAKAEVRKVMDQAAEIKCSLVNLWFGQDGYDYCFQADYLKAWELLIRNLREVADHNPNIRLGVEYKIKEPRTHCFVGTVGKTILLLQAVDRPNVGAIIDMGHALAAYENCAESIALLKMHGDKLFSVHLNDNYRLWDDDLMVGSVHIIEYLELLYWLEKTGYDYFYSLDIWPAREDGVGAASECIRWIKGLRRVIEKIGMEELEELIQEGDATKASATIREVLLP
jgi:xylose isomerase